MGNHWGFFSLEKAWSDLHFRKLTQAALRWLDFTRLLAIFTCLPAKIKIVYSVFRERKSTLCLFNPTHDLDSSCSWKDLLRGRKFQLGNFKNYFYEVNLDLYVRDNTQRSHIPFLQFLSTVISWITKIQYHSQEMGVNDLLTYSGFTLFVCLHFNVRLCVCVCVYMWVCV